MRGPIILVSVIKGEIIVVEDIHDGVICTLEKCCKRYDFLRFAWLLCRVQQQISPIRSLQAEEDLAGSVSTGATSEDWTPGSG